MNALPQKLSYQLYIIRAIYVATFGFCFAIPTMVPYISDTLGSASYYFYLTSISSAIGLFLGVPGGVLADKWGRKNSIVVGLFFYTIGWFILSIATEWSAFIAAFFIRGLGSAVIFSTTSAYLLDILEYHQRDDLYKVEEARKKTYGIPLFAGITLFSGLVYSSMPSLPFVLNGVFCGVLCVLALLFLPNVEVLKLTPADELTHTKESTLKTLLSPHKPLLWLMLCCGVWVTILNYTIFAFQAHYIDIGATELFMAFAIASVYILRGVGAWFTQKKSGFRVVSLFAIFMLVCLVVSAYTINIWIVALLMLSFSLAREFVSTNLVTGLTQLAPRHHRSKVQSMANFSGTLVTILLNMISGWVILNYQGQGVLLLHAVSLLLICGITWFMYFKLRTKA